MFSMQIGFGMPMGGNILQRAMSMAGGGFSIGAVSGPGDSMAFMGTFGADQVGFSPEAMMGASPSCFNNPMMNLGCGMPMGGMNNGMGMIPGMMPQMGQQGGVQNPMMMMLMMMLMQMMQMMMQQQGMGGAGMMGGMPGMMGMPGMGMPLNMGMPGMGMPGATPFGNPLSMAPPYGHSRPLPPFAAGSGSPMGMISPGGGSASGNHIANTAQQWVGQNFKPGQSCRCADFVSTVLRQSGAVGSNFSEVSCQRLQQHGQHVQPGQMRPGDVVFFGNTYRQGQYTHTGIYVGNGQFVHRNTRGGPVRVDRLDRGYYAQHFTGARRIGQANNQGPGVPNFGNTATNPIGPGTNGTRMPSQHQYTAGTPNPQIGIPDFGPNPNRRQVDQMLQAAAQRHGIPADVLRGVAWQESGWRANASSFDGGHGKGIMQIDDRFHDIARTNAVWDPVNNIDYGAGYLRTLYNRTGNWQQALRRYNGGSDYPPRIFAHMQNKPWQRYLS